MSVSLDLLIENGTVVDGSGEPGFQATVGVTDDRRLRILRDGGHEARERIDATGLVVAPGSSTSTATPD